MVERIFFGSATSVAPGKVPQVFRVIGPPPLTIKLLLPEDIHCREAESLGRALPSG